MDKNDKKCPGINTANMKIFVSTKKKERKKERNLGKHRGRKEGRNDGRKR